MRDFTRRAMNTYHRVIFKRMPVTAIEHALKTAYLDGIRDGSGHVVKVSINLGVLDLSTKDDRKAALFSAYKSAPNLARSR